ncbi:FIST signal transduction protein [Marinifilum sp.]|uniref:FIST signal transduction protein n=1 Tax=Marinifilum sp. TaxID=2033137 RepID=UPI003BAB0D84
MFLENPTLNDIISGINELFTSEKSQLLLLIGEKCDVNLNDLVANLNRKNILFNGGIFPKVIHKNITSEQGVVIKKVDFELVTIYFNSETEFLNKFSDYQDHNFTTAFTLIDGLSESASEQLMTLFTHLGNNVRFFGGGVGRLRTNTNGILINNDGVYNTGTIVVFLSAKTKMDAKHGWKKSIGPFIVTRSEKNLIKELNWENAFDVYSRCLKDSQNILLTKENFFKYSVNFPFGFFKEERDYIVRDPMEVNKDGYIICVGNIPENSLVDILSIEEKKLNDIPKKMISNCLEESQNAPIAVLFTCISRVNHLKEKFDEELQGFNSELLKHFPNCELEGALSIGEIYSSGKGYLELLNKSIVLGVAY